MQDHCKYLKRDEQLNLQMKAFSAASQGASEKCGEVVTELQAIIAGERSKEEWSLTGDSQESIHSKLQAWIESAARDNSLKLMPESEPSKEEVLICLWKNCLFLCT